MRGHYQFRFMFATGIYPSFAMEILEIVLSFAKSSPTSLSID